MYTFCSFLQLLCNFSPTNLNYKGFIVSKDNVPSWKANSTWEIIKSLSAFAKAILDSNNRLLDWITSSVVRVLPESYSSVIPSLAISAALSCALVASSTLLDDWYFDQAFEISVLILFFVSFNINWYLSLFNRAYKYYYGSQFCIDINY